MVDFEMNPIKFEVSCCKVVMETTKMENLDKTM